MDTLTSQDIDDLVACTLHEFSVLKFNSAADIQTYEIFSKWFKRPISWDSFQYSYETTFKDFVTAVESGDYDAADRLGNGLRKLDPGYLTRLRRATKIKDAGRQVEHL